MIEHWKAKGLDFSRLFYKPDAPKDRPTGPNGRTIRLTTCSTQADREGDAGTGKQGRRSSSIVEIKNVDRSAGAMLSGEVAKRYGYKGLPDDTICGQAHRNRRPKSFGAFLAHGVTIDLVGDANDYVGKGLSGGRIIVRPPENSSITPENSIIVGNTVLYGAIEGRMLLPRCRGRALCRAQLGRHRGGRGRAATMAANT
jgi:glutamate synthase (NADPH/NADH) large chain